LVLVTLFYISTNRNTI